MESTNKSTAQPSFSGSPAPQAPGLDPRRFTILLIDDEERQLKMLRYLVERAGFRVEVAKSAPEGLIIMERRFIDMVVCDLRMPDVDGLSFVRYIKRLRTFPRNSVIPVMVLTAAGPKLEKEALAAGADVFCLKEQALHSLVPLISAVLQAQE